MPVEYTSNLALVRCTYEPCAVYKVITFEGEKKAATPTKGGGNGI